MSVLPSNSSLNDDLLTDSRDPTLVQKWVAVFFVALSMFGVLYISILPVTIETQIETYFNVDDADYNFIFTIGGTPSLFMPLVGGFLMDYFGTRKILFLSLSLVLLGQCVMTLGCYLQQFWMLVLGNVIVSFLSDTLQIAKYKLTTKLFYDKQLAFAMALGAIFVKLSIISGSVLTPFVYGLNNSITAAWMSGTVACVISLLAGIVAITIDYRLDLKENKIQVAETPHGKDKVSIYDLKHLSGLVWLLGFAGGTGYCAFSALYDNIGYIFAKKIWIW